MDIIFLEFSLMFGMMLLHLFLTPFTKVEESFNLQAMYDLLYKPWTNVSSFDHIEFPGVVPRTFVGPLIISLLSVIPKKTLNASPFTMLHIVRGTLGSLVVLSLLKVRTSLSHRCSGLTGIIFTALTVSQFHTLFYASRSLPNIFALVLTNLALAYQLEPTVTRKPYRAVVLLSLACALFRSELCLYIFMTVAVNLAAGHISIFATVIYGLQTAVVTALGSVIVDSYFWQRLSYPELEVFYFNVVLNKSSAWGTHPLLWYFYNALPRALGGSYILSLKALIAGNGDLGTVMLPALMFVGVYSILPHKELRFIFYVLPVFNAAAAVAIETEIRRIRLMMAMGAGKKDDTSRTAWRLVDQRAFLFAGFVLLTFACSTAQSFVSSAASLWNYPSGNALLRMHELEDNLCKGFKRLDGYVHIDVDSAMSGISQFIQESYDKKNSCWKWRYSKREDTEDLELEDFTHLLWNKAEVEGFCVIHVEDKYAGVGWRQGLKRSPHTYVHRNMNVSTVGCL